MRGTAIAFAALFAVAAGCREDQPFEPASLGTDVETASLDVAAEHGGNFSKSPLVTFADPEVVVGSSALLRSPEGIRVRAATSGLAPGSATTFWVVVFNNPEHCVDGCNIDDVFLPDVQADALYTDGRFIAASGNARYGGEHALGDISNSIAPGLGLPSVGILDVMKAEFHIIVRSHGAIVPEIGRAQITTWAGGCAGLPPELGPEGPNTCEDVNFAVHMP
jgi:hypothetical protein